MSNALDNVLANAKAAAASMAVETTTAVAVVAPQQTALARPGTNFVNAGGIDVDAYLKIDKAGIKLGDGFKGYIDEVEVTLDLSEVIFIYQCRAEQPGTSKILYLKSYDGVTTTEGKSFLNEVQRFETNMVKSTGIYETAEIPFMLVNDVKDPKSTTVLKAGSTVGVTPAPTGIKPFRRLMKQVAAGGGNHLMDVVKVRLTHETKANNNGQEYGVLAYELIAA